MKSVVIWADEFFPILGGLEKSIHRTAQQLYDKGHRVTVLTLRDGLNRQNLDYEVMETQRDVFCSTLQSIILKKAREGNVLLYIARLFVGYEEKQLNILSGLPTNVYRLLRIPSTWSHSRYRSKRFTKHIDQAIQGFICLNQVTYELIGHRYKGTSKNGLI